MSKTRSSRKIRRSGKTASNITPSEPCPLCRIIGNEELEERFNIRETAPPKNSVDFFIVATKNKKGHDYRYMIVLKDHTRTIVEDVETEAISRFFKFMKNFGVDFAIMESTHATIGDHWHRVGTDLNPTADDAKQITDTERFEVRFRKAGG